MRTTKVEFKSTTAYDVLKELVNTFGAETIKRVVSQIESEENTDIWAELHPVIAVDFDGVLNHYSGWTGKYEHYPIREGAEDFLRRVKELGYNIVIFTARPEHTMPEVEEWLEQHDLNQYISVVTNSKPPASAYVDDRGITFTGNYEAVIDVLPTFRAFWEGEEHLDGPTEEQKKRLMLGEN